MKPSIVLPQFLFYNDFKMVSSDSQDPNRPAAPIGASVSPMTGGSAPVSQPPKPAQPSDGFVPSGERKETPPVKKEKVFEEKVPIVERVPPKEVGPEVKDWMERLETGEEIQLPQSVTDDTTGQVIVEPSTPEKVEVKLPLTEAEIQRGLRQEIVESIRWLAEWCGRLVKKIGKKFFYRSK